MTVVNRYATLHLQVERELPSTDALDELLVERGLHNQPQEALWVAGYDSIQRIRTVIEVARGGYHDRFQIAHNPPTDDIGPTYIDVDMTEKIMDAANTCGMYFEDHLIIGPSGRTFSFVRHGMLTPAEELSMLASTHRKVPVKRKR